MPAQSAPGECRHKYKYMVRRSDLKWWSAIRAVVADHTFKFTPSVNEPKVQKESLQSNRTVFAPTPSDCIVLRLSKIEGRLLEEVVIAFFAS